MAWVRLAPHMAWLGCSEAQTAGRSGWPKMRQRAPAPSCTQGSAYSAVWVWPDKMLAATLAQGRREVVWVPLAEEAPIVDALTGALALPPLPKHLQSSQADA